MTVKTDSASKPPGPDASEVAMLKDATKNQSSTTLGIQKLESDELGLKVVSQRAKESSQRESSAEPSVAEPLPAVHEEAQTKLALDYGNRSSQEASMDNIMAAKK